MSSNDDYQAYKADKRVPCKYGANCYQKNPAHHTKYKHPPTKDSDNEELTPPIKKIKLDDSEDLFSSSEEENDSNQSIEVAKTADNPSTSKTVLNKEEGRSKIPASTETESIKELDIDRVEDEDFEDGIKDPKRFIKSKFLFNVPDDFFKFWDFCKNLNEKNPLEGLKGIGFILCGPFDVLAGKFDGVKFEKDKYLRHWRYFYDPPEFQTVMRHVSNGYHFGYFRDDPNSSDFIVAANDVNKNYQITGMGDNLFTALKNYLDVFSRSFDPFAKIKVTSVLKVLSTKYAEYLNKFSNMKQREKKIVCKTFHKMGLVVPFDRKSEMGYRELTESDANLKRLLAKLETATNEDARTQALSNLQPIITMANIATDECDFGTGLELGLDFFCQGNTALDKATLSLLGTGYKLLDRHDFFTIVQAHFEDRKKGIKLSILDSDN